ncbi:hypothetical protein R1sor_012805 [Riccia sorocarpa]|uniref:HTH CENPB-type domain-containing protein n=1 Tax=Riccia sorocarpa TaxID=122646 RepID=A0ABD3I862_9MARC
MKSVKRTAVSDVEKQKICQIVQRAGGKIKQEELKREQNAHLTDILLLEKASTLAKHLNLNDFSASNGWLSRFKQRHDIRMVTLHGEGDDACEEGVNIARCNLPKLITDEGYEPRDVFNFDETGLFYRQKPQRTLVTRAVSGQKKHKDRITLGVCVNADGSERWMPVVITTAKRPRSFGKTWQPSSICFYYHNPKAWMNSMAMLWACQTWRDLSPDTIKNCWRKVSILPVSWNADIRAADQRQHCQEKVEAEELISLISALNLGTDAMSSEEYIDLPEERITEIEYTDEEIIELVNPQSQGDSLSADIPESDDDEPPPVVSLAAASNYASLLSVYLAQRVEFPAEDQLALQRIMNRSTHMSIAQVVRRSKSRLTFDFLALSTSMPTPTVTAGEKSTGFTPLDPHMISLSSDMSEPEPPNIIAEDFQAVPRATAAEVQSPATQPSAEPQPTITTLSSDDNFRGIQPSANTMPSPNQPHPRNTCVPPIPCGNRRNTAQTRGTDHGEPKVLIIGIRLRSRPPTRASTTTHNPREVRITQHGQLIVEQDVDRQFWHISRLQLNGNPACSANITGPNPFRALCKIKIKSANLKKPGFGIVALSFVGYRRFNGIE